MSATLYLYADRVRIVAGRHEVKHVRKFLAHEGSMLAATSIGYTTSYRTTELRFFAAPMERGLQEQVFSATYIESFLQRSLVFQEEIP